MATKKTDKKAGVKNNKKQPTDKIVAEIKMVTDELIGLAKEAKKRYDKVDDKTKKQVVAGVAGAATLIAAAVGISKIARKK